MTEDTLDEERLRNLLARAGELPKSIEPPPDAWGEIRGVITEAGSQHATRAPRSARPRALWQRPVFLAAAALLLVAGSSVVTALAIGRRDAGESSGVAAVKRPADLTAPASLVEFTVVENDYIGTANRLSAILESQEHQLAPGTLAKLRVSLRVIDAAILEARQALATDPANRELMEMLSGSYNQKVDLLRRSTEMAES